KSSKPSNRPNRARGAGPVRRVERRALAALRAEIVQAVQNRARGAGRVLVWSAARWQPPAQKPSKSSKTAKTAKPAEGAGAFAGGGAPRAGNPPLSKPSKLSRPA